MTHLRAFGVRAVRLPAVIALAAAIAVLPVMGAAEDAPPVPTATPFPQTGAIASTESGGFGQKSADLWGGTSLDGANAAPISGSVSSVGSAPKSWLLKLYNNSKDSYSVDVALEQKSRTGGILKSDNYSVSLAPGASVERKASAHPNSISAAVNLRGWKKTSKSPEVATPTPTAGPGKKKGKSDSDEESDGQDEPVRPPPRKRIR